MSRPRGRGVIRQSFQDVALAAMLAMAVYHFLRVFDRSDRER